MAQDEAELEVKAGFFAWGAIRDMVRKARFDGYDVRLFESSGLLSRRFVIKGDKSIVAAIGELLVEAKERATL